jgi:hypothetical protein
MLEPQRLIATPATPAPVTDGGSLTLSARIDRGGVPVSRLHEDLVPLGLEPSEISSHRTPFPESSAPIQTLNEPGDEPVQGFDALDYGLGPPLRRDEV